MKARFLRFSTPALVILLALAVASPAQAKPAFFAACERLLKIYFRDAEFVEARAKEFLPAIVEANRARWRARAAELPETANGLGTAEALELLARLKGRADPTAGGRLVRNATFFVSLAERQGAVVKRVHTRSEMGDARVYNFTNNVKNEVIAFLLDRYLGLNLVPPVIMLDAVTVAQLRVHAAPVTLRTVERDPGSLLEATHLRLLDLLMGNGDRGGPDNLLRQADGKLVGIDFDLSRASPFMPVEAAEYSLRSNNVLLEPGRRAGKEGFLPGVFAKEVVQKLTALDRGTLVLLARQHGVTLSENELTSILATRAAALHVIEKWKQTYGAALIEI